MARTASAPSTATSGTTGLRWIADASREKTPCSGATSPNRRPAARSRQPLRHPGPHQPRPRERQQRGHQGEGDEQGDADDADPGGADGPQDVALKSIRPARLTATVSPLNSTVRPAVARVRSRAPSGRDLSSSRKRLVSSRP